VKSQTAHHSNKAGSLTPAFLYGLSIAEYRVKSKLFMYKQALFYILNRTNYGCRIVSHKCHFHKPSYIFILFLIGLFRIIYLSDTFLFIRHPFIMYIYIILSIIEQLYM